MSRHPEPPASFRLLVVRVSWRWRRIHAVRHDPIHFGREPRNRFDAPTGDFGVLYVAKDAHGAFIETFGHATGVRFVTARELAARGLAEISASRPLRLADLRAAIFDRARPVVTARRTGSLGGRRHRALLARVLDTYKFGLVP